MAKKKKNKNIKVCKLVAIICGIGAALTILLDTILVKSNLTSEFDQIFTGINVVFGNESTKETLETLFEFNFLALLPYVIALVSTVLLVLFKSKNKFIISAVLFVGSAVMFFLLPSFMDAEQILLQEYQLAFGAIIGGSLSIVGALSCAAVYVL